ncbi:hypothetical protein BaRGS_00014532 [Batillaria attramentaria]|uniref:Uncharacterized protein n=1 Tax=Batillaria attramentaria TaxID=370345 RepID=A0ABD0L4I1_9CAEN
MTDLVQRLLSQCPVSNCCFYSYALSMDASNTSKPAAGGGSHIVTSPAVNLSSVGDWRENVCQLHFQLETTFDVSWTQPIKQQQAMESISPSTSISIWRLEGHF